MHKMTLNRTRIIATIIVSSLFAANPATAEDTSENMDAVAETSAKTTTDTVEVNRILAESAHTAAVEDAVEAVLAAIKQNLDLRFIGRTSLEIVDGP